MQEGTAIYGRSRGYLALTLFSAAAAAFSAVVLYHPGGRTTVEAMGLIGFLCLFLYAWRRSTKRIVVMRIAEAGFCIEDPAQAFGMVPFEEIEELRIYAAMEHPVIGIRLIEPDRLRRRGPTIARLLVKPVWPSRDYQILIQLDQWDDQIASIKSVAARAGIPVRSELA